MQMYGMADSSVRPLMAFPLGYAFSLHLTAVAVSGSRAPDSANDGNVSEDGADSKGICKKWQMHW